DFIPDDPDLADRDLGVEHQAGRGGLRPRDEPLQGHVDAIAHHVEEVDLAGTGVAAEVNGDIAGDDDLDVARRHPYPGLYRGDPWELGQVEVDLARGKAVLGVARLRRGRGVDPRARPPRARPRPGAAGGAAGRDG